MGLSDGIAWEQEYGEFLKMSKFKVGDKAVCKHPVIVSDLFKGTVGVVVDVADFSDLDAEEQIITIDYGGCEQTAFVELDGVELVEQQKSPTESTVEPTESGYDLSGYMDWMSKATMDELIDRINDPVNSPKHYGQGSIECIDYIKDVLTVEEYIGYLRGNLIKYHHRYRYKGKPVEDLEKAKVYLEWLIEVTKENSK